MKLTTNAGGGNGPDEYANLTAYEGRMYFSARTATAGNELWQSDGTAAGTMLALDLLEGSGSSSPAYLRVAGDALFFGANGDVYKSNGTAGGTAVVMDAARRLSSFSPLSLTTVGTTIYFTASAGGLGREMWKTDGTEAGTVGLGALTPRPGAAANELTGVGDHLFCW